MGFKRITVQYEIDSVYGDITVKPNSNTSVHISQIDLDTEKHDLIVIERKNLADLIDVLIEIDNEGG